MVRNLTNYDSSIYTNHGEVSYRDKYYTLFETGDSISCGIGNWFYWPNNRNVTRVSYTTNKEDLLTKTYYRSPQLAEDAARKWASEFGGEFKVLSGGSGNLNVNTDDRLYNKGHPKYTPIKLIKQADSSEDLVLWYSSQDDPNHCCDDNYVYRLKKLSEGWYDTKSNKTHELKADGLDRITKRIQEKYENCTVLSINENDFNQLSTGETTTMARTQTIPQPDVTAKMTLDAFIALLTRGPVFFKDEDNNRDDENAAAFVELRNTGLCDVRDGWYFINHEGMAYACRTGAISFASDEKFEQPSLKVDAPVSA